jgi:hypothetical protein
VSLLPETDLKVKNDYKKKSSCQHFQKQYLATSDRLRPTERNWRVSLDSLSDKTLFTVVVNQQTFSKTGDLSLVTFQTSLCCQLRLNATE